MISIPLKYRGSVKAEFDDGQSYNVTGFDAFSIRLDPPAMVSTEVVDDAEVDVEISFWNWKTKVRMTQDSSVSESNTFRLPSRDRSMPEMIQNISRLYELGKTSYTVASDKLKAKYENNEGFYIRGHGQCEFISRVDPEDGYYAMLNIEGSDILFKKGALKTGYEQEVGKWVGKLVQYSHKPIEGVLIVGFFTLLGMLETNDEKFIFPLCDSIALALFKSIAAKS